VSIERTYYCDGPDCPAPMDGETPRCVRTTTPPPYLPIGTIETREQLHGEDALHHFCSWDCLMKFAAQKPATEYQEWTGP
jgi:hypothetical protein